MDRYGQVKAQVYCCRAQYDGSSYCGWQRQVQSNSIQQTIEAVLTTVLRQSISILGASRTDAGVHAECQVFTFKSDHGAETASVLKSANALLGDSIRLYGMDKCDEGFHPIHSARSKLYRYRICLGSKAPPFLSAYCWTPRFRLDEDLLRRSLESFVGTHDFSAFCASDSSAKTKERQVLGARWRREGEMAEIALWGQGFLKQMCRSIVGTAIDVARGYKEHSVIERALSSGERSQVGVTAPAKGLILSYIDYSGDFDFEDYLQCVPVGGILLGFNQSQLFHALK